MKKTGMNFPNEALLVTIFSALGKLHTVGNNRCSIT